MKPTMKAIAEAAKISRGTVDRVLNDRPGVSHEIRERVKKIAQDMGYEPNLVGKALAYQKNPFRIGVIILNRYDPFFQEVHKGVLEALNEFKDFGINLEIRMMESISIQEQLRCIKELIKENIVALALSPLEEDIIKAELQKLNSKNIKIITFNTDITKVDKLCFVGQNLVKSGRVAGELMGKMLPHGGEIVIISGSSRVKALQERIKGFTEIIESEYKALTILDVIENVMNDEDSYIVTQELISRYPKLKGIFITSRGVGGVGSALQRLNHPDRRLICNDLSDEIVKLIENKVIDVTITQEPFMQGYLPIKIFFEYFFKNQKPMSHNIYTKLQIITKENIEN